jgi:hypothetical protein
MEYLKAFLAGFAATLIFHQGTLAALHAAKLWPKPPFAMAPTAPFRVPAVISLAFWGGVWSIALWLVIRGLPDAQYWGYAVLLGALAPSVVALFVVFPLKKMPLAGGWDPKVIVPVLMLNGAWGLGAAIFMRLAGLAG